MTELIVADDEKNIRAGLLKILSESFPGQLRIREAKNGEEALALAQDCPADIVITDIRMPKLDGVALMRALSAFANPPSIIVLSGYDDFSYAREAIRSGARAYILKPVDRNELVARSKTQVRRKRYADRLRDNVQQSMEMAIIDPLTKQIGRAHV